VDAVLADLGLSSEQLAESHRGFSFQGDEPLGMTLSSRPVPGALTAYEVVNFWREPTLADVIYGYGEERFARRIAKAIVLARAAKPLETTGQLVEVIKTAVPARYHGHRRHFATKTFQALRIAVNDELGALQNGLGSTWQRLNQSGRVAVITFHSLEARAVKRFCRERVAAAEAEMITKHAIRPTRSELLRNPRARSAQLRIIRKI
jgi:16S rRNA (cytosine1402-N4)-methyltransferase